MAPAGMAGGSGRANGARFAGVLGRAEVELALAVADTSGDACGYVVEGASPRVRTRLGIDRPAWGALRDADVGREGGPPFPLLYGVVGAGCGLAFVLGRTFPAEGERVGRETLVTSLVTCHLAIHVLRRSGPNGVDGARLGVANARFPFTVSCRLGPAIPRWRALDLATADLRASLDGNLVALGERDRDPLDAALWLAEGLVGRERVLEAGQVVVTGLRVGILQVLPGQTLAVRGSALGGLSMTFA